MKAGSGDQPAKRRFGALPEDEGAQKPGKGGAFCRILADVEIDRGAEPGGRQKLAAVRIGRLGSAPACAVAANRAAAASAKPSSKPRAASPASAGPFDVHHCSVKRCYHLRGWPGDDAPSCVVAAHEP